MKHEASVTKASSITLRSGRELALCGLAQELTYEGLLEGVPKTAPAIWATPMRLET